MLQDRPVTILLAEDEPLVRNMISVILGSQGYRILEAVNGKDALEVANQHQPETIDLLISDIVMPVMSGLELVKQFKESHPQAGVILMSGFTEDPELDDVQSEHQTEFLSKPFMPQVLTQKIEEVLNGAAHALT